MANNLAQVIPAGARIEVRVTGNVRSVRGDVVFTDVIGVWLSNVEAEWGAPTVGARFYPWTSVEYVCPDRSAPQKDAADWALEKARIAKENGR